MSKIIVIGGGAAGMMAAIAAADTGKEVVLYEKNEKLGKKIYITGKGRCNVTNASDLEEILKNIVSNPKFMYSSLYTFSNDAVMDFLENSLNVPLKTERGNRVFPVSDKSSDIIGGLARGLKERGVKVCLNSPVKSLIIEGNQVNGVVLTDSTKDMADGVIVATGGVSYSSTGSTGDGYRFAKETGHRIVDCLPALVPLEVKEEFVKSLKGLSLKNIEASFEKNGKAIYKEFGEMLFTHFGVSGPVILSASSYITGSIKAGDEIKLKIDLKPAITKETLDERILREFAQNVNKDFRNSITNLLPKSLIPVIIEMSGIDRYKKVNEITKEEREKLVNVIKSMELTITGTRGFNEAIITQGGVSVKDVNPATMESKIINGLYFAGEVLDIDALTGGYNLQLAWSTGYLAGISS